MNIFQKIPQLFLLLLVISVVPVNAAPISLKVMVNNLAPEGGTSLTPVWVGFHDGSFDSYNGGETSSAALQALAEDGDTGSISAAFAATPGGVDGAVLGDNPPLIQPGQSGQAMFTIDNGASNRYFSYASMVLASNDYFVANGNPLVHDISSLLDGSVNEISFFIGLLGTVNDAGTEVNDFNSSAGNPLFPGLPAGQTAAGQGADENGVITIVDNPYLNFLNTPTGVDLSALDFSQYPNGIAEVTLSSAVPIPAALPLAMTGFSMIFGMSRLRKKKYLAS